MEELNFDDIFSDLEEINARYFEEDRIREENIATKGNFRRGLESGVDSFQGSLYGAAGIAGDALGIDSVRDWGFEGYQRNQDEAGLNPVDVQNFTDISTDKGLLETASDTAKWFVGTLGQLTPSVAEGLVTTLIGAGVGTASAPGVGTVGGALAGMTGRKVVLKAIDEAVESKVKSGIAKEIAEREVKEEIISRAKLGGNIGLIQGTAAIEGGGMWGEAAEKHGVENANAGSAFVLGQVSGLSEAYSPGGMLIKRIAGIKDVGSEAASKLADTFLKRLGTEVPKSMSGEAAQEVFQSFLGVLNKKIQDPTISLTDRDAILEYINSAAAGAAGGVVFGGVSVVFPENHTVDDVLNEHAANTSVEAAVARQQIQEAGPIKSPEMDANTVPGILGEKQEDPLTIIPRGDDQFQRINASQLQPAETAAAGIVQQPAADDITRLDSHIRDMAKSLYPDKTKGENLPDWVKLRSLKNWEKETGEDVKSYVSSTSAKQTLKAVIEGEPLNEKQAKVWAYLKSIAENKAMVEEQKVPFDEGTGEFPDNWGKTIAEPAAKEGDFDAKEQETAGHSPGGGGTAVEGVPVQPGISQPPDGGGGLLQNQETPRLPVQDNKDAVTTPDPNEERFTDMVKILEAQQSVDDVDALYHDMAPIFKARPEMAPYADKWTAARDTAAARISGGEDTASASVLPNSERHEVIDNTDSVAHTQEVKTDQDGKNTEAPKQGPVANSAATDIEVDSKSIPAVIEHTTKKGKLIKGFVLKEITKQQAQDIDKYTFPKDGGFFIREKYAADLDTAGLLKKTPAQEPTSDKIDGKPVQEAEKPQAKTSLQKEVEKAKGQQAAEGEMTLKEAKDLLANLEEQRREFERGEIGKGRVPIFDARKEKKIREAKDLVAKLEAAEKGKGQDEIVFTVKSLQTGKEEELRLPASVKQQSNKDTTEKQDDGENSDGGDGSGSRNIGDDPGRAGSDPAGQNQPVQNTTDEEKAGRDAQKASSGPDFSKNKVFTADAVAAARERLKAKRSTLASGFDPELMQDLLVLGGAYFEAGIRKFSEWSKTVLADIGDEFKPFLRGTYENLRHWPEIAKEGMSSPEEVEAYLAGSNSSLKEEVRKAKEKAEGGTAANLDLISAGNTDRVKTKGGEIDGESNGQIHGNDRNLSSEDRSEGPGADEKRGGSGRIPGRNGGGLRGSRGSSLPANDGESSSGPGQESAGDRPGKDGGKGSGDKSAHGILGELGPLVSNYTITDADNLGKGGAKTKARDNIKAIEILRELRESGKPATKEQQAALVKYVGWGASELANNMFPVMSWDRDGRRYVEKFKDESWRELGEKLKELLSPKEYAEAKGSTLNGHYTSQTIIQAMYRALSRLGFDGKGRILEPGCGIGNFMGLLPSQFSLARITGVEMDTTTAGIAKLLYPGHDVRNLDFADFRAPDNFYDVAIGNPPFLDVKVTGDPDYAKHKFLVHDFFFAKSIDKVRPGGILMLVTSKGTMDKANDRAREYLRKKADLLGAVRLPQTAFKENAGTEVVTDVIFLRKRKEGETPAGEGWSTLEEVQTKGGESTYVNEYFAKHPEMVLGNHSLAGSMYGPGQYTVEPKSGDIGTLFDEAIKSLPENVYSKETKKTGKAEKDHVDLDFAPSTIKEGGFFLKDGKIYQKENGIGVAILVSTSKKEILTSFIKLRDAVRNVLYVQLKEGVGDLGDAQQELGKAYDEFVEKHGFVNKAKITTRKLKDGSESTSVQYINFSHFKSDPDAYLVASIERYSLEKQTAEKADIFTERVIDSPREPKVETATDALHVSLYRTGGVDLPLIAELLGQSEADVLAALDGVIYLDPDGSRWVTSDEYLSGNVRAKLQAAEAAAEVDKKFQKNALALEKVQPEDLPPERIDVNLGMPIFDPEHIQNFAQDVLEMGVSVSYLPLDGSWKVNAYSGQSAAKATSDFGTHRANAASLLEDALNNSTPKIYDLDENRKPVLNREATEAAVEKMNQIRKAFKEWVWGHSLSTAELIARRFNDLYNNTVKREFGGDYLKEMQFPGMSRVKNPFLHQRRVAWRIIQRGNTYMAHSVGAGKTIASIISGMEMKRLGIKKKPVWTVPGHMLKQFAGEFLELYPAAKILVADEEQFSKENRNRFMGRVASENWDAIIITHSAFGMIPMSADFQAQFLHEQMAEVETLLQEQDGDRTKRKQLERLKKRLEARLKKIMDSAGKDKGVNFEETGIDQIFVDEAHAFRKLDFATNQTNIKGIDPAGSMMSFDLYVKTKYLESLYPNRSLVLMSGTPITNTLGEVYTIQRFLQEDKLRELGLHHFDSWSSTFGGMVTNIEQAPDGKYKSVTRFGDFNNLQSLCAMWGEIGDFVHAKDLDYIKRPKVRGGGRKLIVGETSELQREFKQQLATRVERIEARKRPPQKGDDIILSVITDGRHAALDDRYIESNAPLREDSKTAKLLEKTFEIWERTKKQKGTQMIFADLGVPSSEEKRGFSIYRFIKEQLIAKGVPEHEIAFMQDYKNSDQKRKLFQDMNQGKVRFLIGSSIAMGTGVNAQKKLIALHHFDADSYLPANIEQREGRIVRQGNENEEVEVYAYIARGSYDETMWQFLETKQRFIDDFLSGNVSADSASDIDGAADSFAEARAMSSDNPLAIELAGVNNELGRLEALYKAHQEDQRVLARKKNDAEWSIERLEASAESLEKGIAKRKTTRGDSFSAEINGKTYADRAKAGEAVLKLVSAAVKEEPGVKTIGVIGGFGIELKMVKILSRKTHVELRLKESSVDVSTPWKEVDLDGLKDMSTTGLVMRFENALRDLDDRLESAKAQIKGAKRQIEESKNRIGQEFQYMEMLQEKRERRKEIVAELERLDKGTRESRSTGKGRPADVMAELRERLGAEELDALIESGVLEIVDQGQAAEVIRHSEKKRVAQAVTTGSGKVRLFQGVIKEDEAWAVLLHELGNHSRYLLFSSSEYKAILESLERRQDEDSATGRAIREAMQSVPSKTKPKHYWEEVLGYMIEYNPETTLVRRVIALIKKLLLKIRFPADILTTKDLTALAEIAVRAASIEAKGAQHAKGINTGRTGSGDPRYSAKKSGVDEERYRGVGQAGRDIPREEHRPGQAGAEKQFRSVTKEDFSSEAFNRWFGESQAVDESGDPLTFHHGSPTFGHPSGSYSFGEKQGSPKSPMAALGHFFAEERAEAIGYSKGTGNVGSFVLRLEKPHIIQGWQLPTFPTVQAAKEYAERLKARGYDGIYLQDQGHAIIFTPNQAKSLDRQTGEFSLDNDDVRYSMKEDDPFSVENIQETAGSIKVLKRNKKDSTFLDRVFSTPEYYFKKFAAAGRVLQAALNRRDLRYQKEHDILEDFATYIQELKKSNKDAYEEANDYLIHTDQSTDGWRIRFTDDEKWKVVMPRWAVKLKEGEKFTPDKAVVGVYDDEQVAIKTMISSEVEALGEKGYSEKALEAIRRARELTNRGFDIMAEDMRRIIREAAENGQPNPYVGDGKLDESGRYGIYQKGKSRPIALYANEQEANEALAQAAEMMSYVVTANKKGKRTFNNLLKAKAWAEKHSGTVEGMKRFQNLRVKRRTDAEMRPLTVRQALAQMGDLRGIYFPRIREAGEYVLIARKDGENPIRKHFDIPLVGDKHPKLQELMKNLRIPIAREAFELKKKGYEVIIKRDDSPAEEVFEATNLVSSLDAILQSSMSVIDKNSDADVRAGQHVNQILTMQIADIFKARGYLSTRIKRLAGDEVWEGYEEDMGKALVQYAKNVASGTAKRDTARAMILAFSGRDYSWHQYKQEVDEPDWAEYMKIVEERRIDERTQKNLFRDVRNFMIDVLRNEEQADRIIGTLKGLAVLKYLGFRVSSAAVNLTNMVQGVPATLAGHTGEAITEALGRVIAAATAYGKYRTGKGSNEDKKIFRYISEMGWDEAQFNYEAASVLRSKVGETWNKFMTASMFMFGAAEKANRAATLYAAYKAVRAKEKTMEEDEVWRLAKEISDRAHGVYGKETLPAWARGKYNLLRLTYTFQKFSHNYMLNMIDLGFTRKEYKAAAYMLLSPAILAGAGASIASPVLFAAAGALGLGGDDPEEAWYDWMEELFGGGSFARHGLFGVVGINVKGSLQMNLPMHSDIQSMKAIDLAGPAGGILYDTAKGFHHLFRGELAKGGESLLPTAFGSMSKSIREATEGITTSNYGTVFYGDEPLKADAADAFLRFLSFNPSRVSGIREKQWNEKEVAERYQDEKSEIYAKIKRLYLQGEGLTPEILKTIKAYNGRVFESGRRDIKPITSAGISEMLKRNSRASKIERMRAA